MTGSRLLAQLMALSPEELQLPLIAVHGASGMGNDVGSVFVHEVSEGSDGGPLCDMVDGEQYLELYIGH